jgi:hypothetical protein
MNNFITVLNANLATFGLVAADLTPLTNARNDFQTKLGNFQTAEAAFRAASEAKKTSRNTAEPLFRQMAQRINRHPAMTNERRAQLRLTVPKPRQRRGVGPEIPGVRLEVDAGRVVIHFGTNPDDERRNGKPDWAIGANIYIKAEDEADYRLLAFDTASPYVWEYRGAPKRFSFRVAYRGTRERDEGTLSPEETVSRRVVGANGVCPERSDIWRGAPPCAPTPCVREGGCSKNQGAGTAPVSQRNGKVAIGDPQCRSA